MTEKSYTLEFGGYWREPSVSGLPEKSGIYGVCACVYDSNERTVDLKRLLYIGEAADVRDRMTNHEGWSAWKRQLKFGEVVCVNAALVSPQADRQRAEAAMIFKHKPPCNTEYKDSFPFDTTTIKTSGRNALIAPSFTVHRTEKAVASLGHRWI